MNDAPEKIWIDLMNDEQPLYYTANPHRLEMDKYIREDTAKKLFIDEMNEGEIAERIKQIATQNVKQAWDELVEAVGIDTANAMAEESNSWKAIKADLEIK